LFSEDMDTPSGSATPNPSLAGDRASVAGGAANAGGNVAPTLKQPMIYICGECHHENEIRPRWAAHFK